MAAMRAAKPAQMEPDRATPALVTTTAPLVVVEPLEVVVVAPPRPVEAEVLLPEPQPEPETVPEPESTVVVGAVAGVETTVFTGVVVDRVILLEESAAPPPPTTTPFDEETGGRTATEAEDWTAV